MSETQLAKLVAFVPSIEIGKILGQPKPTLQSVNVVTSIWAKPSCGSYFANYAEKLMCPRKNSWGELVRIHGNEKLGNSQSLDETIMGRLGNP